MSHGLFYCYVSGYGNISVALLSMEGQRALGFHQKYLNFCSEDEWRSYGFGTTWGGVINDRVFIFGWTIPLTKVALLKTFPRVSSAVESSFSEASGSSSGSRQKGSPLPRSAAVFTWGTYPSGRDWDGEVQAWPGGGTEGGGGPLWLYSKRWSLSPLNTAPAPWAKASGPRGGWGGIMWPR